ncbi:MAG TPA: DUF1631 family protein, partial [Hydrogenophaga sp.]|nr:DUF1631 family protein [Hydrogenophaga sp.]
MVSPDQHVSSLAKQARELFVVHVGRALPEMVRACDTRLTSILDQAGSAREMQDRRDAWTAFQKHQTAWLNGSRKALQRTLLPKLSSSGSPLSTGRLELVAEGTIDDQIMASRLAMRVLDKASSDLNDLRLRIQHLERRQELPRGDVLLPDVTARILVDQWLDAQMTREAWAMIQDALAPIMANKLHEGYKAANEFLVSSGVMKEIDLQSLVKRAPGTRTGSAAEPVPPAAGRRSGDAPQQRDASGSGPSSAHGPGSAGGPASRAFASSRAGSSSMGVHDETRMLTSATPLARARMRAQGVVGRLKRLLMDKIGGDFEATQLLPPSPRLEQAMQQSMAGFRREAGGPSSGMEAVYGGAGSAGGAIQMDASHVERASNALRHRAAELKEAASTPTEKATIEVVALMFQSILAEERIPPSVRVWFARLQIPVLRVALAEPEFFSALQHPARKLIDRMGSCVMGFETNVGSAALEAEIKRVVQVIEQYPETGRRVFQLVFDEFQKFLSTYLSEQDSTSRVVSVAQQIEQKETLSVQYTIEL